MRRRGKADERIKEQTRNETKSNDRMIVLLYECNVTLAQSQCGMLCTHLNFSLVIELPPDSFLSKKTRRVVKILNAKPKPRTGNRLHLGILL